MFEGGGSEVHETTSRSGRGGARWTVGVLVLLGVVLAVAATGTAAAQSAPDCSTVTYNGDGTTSNPYEVGDVDQLQCINDQGLDANYTQVSDIDATETASWNGGDGFDPIGDPESLITPLTPFTGTFDGQRHSITGLTINRTTEPAVGLFGRVDPDGEVTNASFVNADIVGSTPTGGLVASNAGTVSESFVSGSVGGPDSITSAAAAGGLVGANEDSGTITESYSTASIDSGAVVGGLVGDNIGTVEKSYATGSAEGLNTVGGLVGGNTGTVSESYATGSVSVDDIGNFPSPFNEESYDTESVTGTLQNIQPAGGLIGLNDGGTVTDSYWDTQTTGQSSSDGGTGLTTSQMTGSAATSNMLGFDFTNTWNTVSGDYPMLAWQQGGDDGDGGGSLSSNNPFGDTNGNPVSRSTVISRVVQWNLNGSINGTMYTRQQIIQFVVQWNLAR